MANTRLILVRHGESAWNLAGRLQGQSDEDNGLTQRGKAQAEAIAQRLKPETFATLYSSDLARAVQTAQIIAQHTGHEVVVDRRLRERHLGILQGLTWDEIRRRYPREPHDLETPGPDYIIPGGESARQCFTRIVTCLEEIACSQPDDPAVIVTHVSALEAMFRHSLHIPPERPRRFTLPNASVNVFFYDKNRWILDTWGETSHLRGIRTSNESQ